MRRKMSAKFSSYFLLLVVGLLMLLSPATTKARNTSMVCEYRYDWKWHWKWVWKWQWRGGEYVYEYVYDYVYEYVYDCFPTVVGNSTKSRGRTPSHPNTVRNADGTLRPAKGYRWVNSKDPNDFRVKLLPGLISPEPGTLRPASCYQWLNPKDPDDFRVEIKLGLVKTETGCRPDKGYRWVNSKDANDFRGERIP